jgi:hypothetical protein
MMTISIFQTIMIICTSNNPNTDCRLTTVRIMTSAIIGSPVCLDRIYLRPSICLGRIHNSITKLIKAIGRFRILGHRFVPLGSPLDYRPYDPSEASPRDPYIYGSRIWVAGGCLGVFTCIYYMYIKQISCEFF